VSSAHPKYQHISFHKEAESDLLETNDEPPLSTVFDLEQLDHWSTPALNLAHNLLVDVESVIRGLFQESLI
jgi:hypothetical protein